MRKAKLVPALAVGVIGAALASPAFAAAPSEACDTASVQAMAPPDTTVAFAARQAGVCLVHGYVTTRDPGPNQVLFVLSMPDNFNGRYLYQGVGGAAGQLPPISQELTREGYAVAGSDGGSGSKNGADFSFQSDPARALDFAWRGVHVSATATQKIAKAYYKRDAINRYIAGCSGGGHMGLENAGRFAREDFDGFIVGATPFVGSPYMANTFRIAQYLQTHPEGWIPPDLLRKADAAILARYDEVDGARDGIIADSRDIGDFDVGILREVGFTPAQIATFNAIRQPYRFSAPGVAGDGVMPGYPITNVAAWSGFLTGTGPPPWPSTATTPVNTLFAKGAPFIHMMSDSMLRSRHPDLYYVDVGKPGELARLALEPNAAATADYEKLAKSGARMIVYHGVNDQADSYLDTLKSTEALRARYPNAGEWLRVFPVAGMMHCAGGPGPTEIEEPLIDALVAWVEQGLPPETVVAPRRSRDRGVERTFRLCAEPARTALRAPGLDPRNAENWVCRAPSPQTRP